MLLPILLVLMQLQAPPRDTRAAAASASATITGVVVSEDAAARPLRRTLVTINGPALEMGRTTITGEDGAFAFTGLPSGSYTLSASKEAYVAMNYGATRSGRPGARLVVSTGDTVRAIIRLPRGAVITGTVLDADGAPVQNVAVRALARRFDGTSGQSRDAEAGPEPMRTDDRGVYRLYGLPAGDYLVAAQPSGNRPADRVRPMERPEKAYALGRVFHPSAVEATQAARIAVAAGEERGGIDIRLQYVALANVSGIVELTPGCDPAEVAIGQGEVPQSSAPARATRTNLAGRFFFTDLPGGRYRLLARCTTAAGGVMVAASELTLDGEDVENLMVALQPAPAIHGLIVFRGESAHPMFGESRASPVPLPLLAGGLGSRMPPLQIDGVRFSIEGAMPGTYRLGGTTFGVRRPLGAWWLQSLIAGGVELLDAPLDLRQNVDGAVALFADRASELSGTVTDTAGRPLNGVPVVAFAADRSAWFFESRRIADATTAAGGRYVIRNLPPGQYRVAVAADLEPREWFDPAALERLLPASSAVTIAGIEQKTIDLIAR